MLLGHTSFKILFSDIFKELEYTCITLAANIY